MDPINIIELLNSLITLASSSAERFDRLDTLLKGERKYVHRYRKANKLMQSELGEVRVLFKAILVRGDTRAVSALLKSTDGQDLALNLSQALIATADVLKKQVAATKALLDLADNHPGSATSRVSSAPTIQLTLFSNNSDKDVRDIDFDKVLQTSEAALSECQTEVSRLFTRFHQLYLVHNVPRAGEPVAWGAEPWQVGNSLDTIQLQFYLHPFHVFIGAAEKPELVERLHALNASRDWAERHTSMMEAVGRRWVEDQLSSDVTVPSLGRVQIDLMKNLWKAVSQESSTIVLGTSPKIQSEELTKPLIETSRPAHAMTDAMRYEQLTEIRASIHNAVKRAKSQKFSIAFCGMVKAGKSLFLNALIGRIILPSDELPSTAWPCRLRHVKGHQRPLLEVDVAPFQRSIRELHNRKYSEMMANYKPPSDDPFAGILDDDQSGSDISSPGGADEMEGQKRIIFSKWIDLHPTTKKNLAMFESKGYRLPSKAEGEDQVIKLLGEINDIVRLCHRLMVPFDGDSVDWPLLSVEFDSLRDQDIDGVFEFIDLPGIGESFEDYSFEDLIRKVSREVDAFVPIVSFKEVPKEDWRRLPSIINTGIGRAPDLVLCTHLDQVSRDLLPEQIANVAKVFWPASPGSHDRVLACSSRMGLSAHMLREMSEHGKPKFIDFWDRKRVEYDCAKEILGVGNPGPNFSRFTTDEWRKAIDHQMVVSGLQKTISRLTTDMVMKAQQRVLLFEGERLRRHLHKAVSEQSRVLLEMRRSEEDYLKAYEDFQRAKESFRRVLDEWSIGETRMHLESSGKLQKSFKVLEAQGLSAAAKAVDATAKNIPQPPKKQTLEPEDLDPDTLVFSRESDAEMFLYKSQLALGDSLTKLKRQFVGLVRSLANQSRTEHFQSLKRTIQLLIQDDIQPELKEDIIDELDVRGASVETLVFSSIRRQVIHTIATRHTAGTAFRAIEGAIAKPLLKSSRDSDSMIINDYEDVENLEQQARTKSFEQLGFMVRAPIAVIATVPWVLGAGVWPFMARSKKYLLNKPSISEHLLQRVVRPFLNALKQEGESTLVSMMKKSSQTARDAVESALDREEKRYESERSQKDQPPSKTLVASALAAISNFLAAEAALLKLQEHLKETL